MKKKKPKQNKLSIFDKLQKLFNKEGLTKEEFGNDGYMLLRFLSMKADYIDTINKIQRYQGVLGWRLAILLEHVLPEKDKAPFLEYIKKEGDQYAMANFNKKSTAIMTKLFNVSSKRLQEYLPNLWCTDEEIAEIWGIN